MDFFNKLTGGDDGKKRGGNAGRGGGPQFKNPFANAGGRGPGGKNFRGGGQALGGTAPGKVICVSLPDRGALGVKVEKRPNSKTAIVSAVLPNSQAEAADLKRGDIVCYPNTDGTVEMGYDEFLKMVASDQRPLVFDVRRIGTASGRAQGGSAAAGGAKSATADAYAKRQAVIAAAEARDRAHKKKSKPISKKGMSADKGPSLLSAAEKRRIEEQREALARQHEAEGLGSNMSEEARRAVAAAKAGEAAHAAELGYNPYETNKVSAGQAKTATVAVTHGQIDAGGGVPSTMPTPGRVAAPSEPTSAAADRDDDMAPIDSQFDEAFVAVTLSNADNSAVVQSLGTMRKLIVNATTKGQTGPDETSAKFRRVRLSNNKIKAAIADVHGALDLMLSVGFVLSENKDDGETYLVFPPGETGPPWLKKALKRMENYEKGSA